MSEGQWLCCVLEILDNNNVNRAVFSDASIKLLVMGGGKGRDIIRYKYMWASELWQNMYIRSPSHHL